MTEKIPLEGCEVLLETQRTLRTARAVARTQGWRGLEEAISRVQDTLNKIQNFQK